MVDSAFHTQQTFLNENDCDAARFSALAPGRRDLLAHAGCR